MTMQRSTLVYKFIAMVLPFVLLLIIEILLRIFNFGYDFTVFVEDKDDASLLHLNADITKKYFTNIDNAPTFNQDRFKKIKPANTYRLFVLGESSAQGFPYFHNGSFPRILKYKLQRCYPNSSFEVINLSITAINSYAINDISKALAEQNPDAVLIYAGHNEYYGALGVGSTQRFGSSPFFANTFLAAKGIRIFQVLTRFYDWVTASLHPELVDRHENLMKRMASEQMIPLHSDVYDKGIEQFKRNASSLLDRLEKNHIPVFIGNLVNNEKDLKPFISRSAISQDTMAWAAAFQQAMLYKSTDQQKSLWLIDQAIVKDTTYALLHYIKGQISYDVKDFKAAKKSFIRGKEFDLLRFRSPEKINQTIKVLATDYNANFVDVYSDFEKNSPNGIIGKELVIEHIHPTIDGYFVLADSYFNAIVASGLIRSNPLEIDNARFRAEYPFTKTDSLKGEYEVLMLKERWPFNEPMHDSISSRGSYESKLAGGLSIRQYKWDNVMNLLYEHYEKNGDKREMLRIMEAMALEKPYDYRYAEGAGYLCNDLDDRTKANYYFSLAFKLKPSFTIAKLIFLNFLRQDRPDLAVPYIDFAIAHPESTVNFVPLKKIVAEIDKLETVYRSDSTNTVILNTIGQKYQLIGNESCAQKYFNRVLAFDPKDRTALQSMHDLSNN